MTFYNNGLGAMFETVFDARYYQAVNSAYPDRFKPWEFNKCPQNYWTLETGKEATKWMIEEKLNWSYEDIKAKLSHKTFIYHGLGGKLRLVFDISPYKAINFTYPDRFKPKICGTIIL